MTTPSPEPPPTPTEDEVDRFAFIYSPHHGEQQTWEFDPRDWTIGEMSIAERLYRKPRDELLEDVNDGYDAAKAVLLWLLRRRTEPDLPYMEVEGMQTGALHLVQLVRDDTQEVEQVEDPEPDAVNNPKAGSSGESESGSDKPPPKLNAVAG